MYKIFLFLCWCCRCRCRFFFFLLFVIRFLCDSIFPLLLPYCSMFDASLNWAHELHLSLLLSVRRGVCSTHIIVMWVYMDVSVRVCECVSVYVSVFFVYVISRSSSVRFRHKAQTPERLENIYTSMFTISLLLVCGAIVLSNIMSGKKKPTHTGYFEYNIYIVYTKEQWLYRKSIEHIKNRKRGANIVVVSWEFLYSHLSSSLPLSLFLARTRTALFSSQLPHFNHIYWRIFHFELISVLIVFNEL